MSEQKKFPSKFLISYNSYAGRFEATPDDKEPSHICIKEHNTILAEKDAEISKLRDALEYVCTGEADWIQSAIKAKQALENHEQEKARVESMG